MPGTSTASTSWMLLTSLLLLIHQAACGPTPNPFYIEFQQDLKDMDGRLQSCSESCGSANSADAACRCLNLSMSVKGCVFPEYFTQGFLQLRNLSDTVTKTHVDLLIDRVLNIRVESNNTWLCSESERIYEPIISGRLLLSKLSSLMQQYRMKLS